MVEIKKVITAVSKELDATDLQIFQLYIYHPLVLTTCRSNYVAQMILSCKSVDEQNQSLKNEVDHLKQERTSQEEKILSLSDQIRKSETKTKQQIATLRVEVSVFVGSVKRSLNNVQGKSRLLATQQRTS
jgi:predicted nucleotide-binding protein (sugar kinase/HSP70/actin superfamily)